MFHNIPRELQDRRQWVSVANNKAPLNPRTGAPASVSDPETWGTFAEACRTGRRIGFVLTAEDPYCFIDLDPPQDETQIARHRKILAATATTYAEVSQSGNGVHIICRASVPRGVRRDKVEVYTTDRYMIMTGNVCNPAPIVDLSEVVAQLWEEMAGKQLNADLHEDPETLPDDVVVSMASTAANSDKFLALWQGDWQPHWASQSEADYALLSMLAFYSGSNAQVRRLFRSCPLGTRAKAQRDAYLDRALRKIRANVVPPADIEGLLALADRVANGPDVPEHTATPTLAPARKRADLVFPPGLVGRLATYIHKAAVRPVREVALASAIGLTAGICGRSYNISGTGLNQYVILLAPTGSGKEGAASGVDKLVSAVRHTVPSVDDFVGPSHFASGQALLRVLTRQPCFVSVLGEVGITLQQLCDPRAVSAERMLKKILLDLYGKSGYEKVLRPAVYSDAEKNIPLVQAPCVTILGESTPETFYGGLDQTHIAEGLIPRFLSLEYQGPRPARNKAANVDPDEALVAELADLAVVALATTQNRTVGVVGTDAEAGALLDAFDVEADRLIDAAGAEVERHLWNRAHLKALKLAALVAVGVDAHEPLIDREVAQWAIDLVRDDIEAMADKFTGGDVGSGETKQEADLRVAVTAYLSMTPDQRRQYRVPKAVVHTSLVPFGYLRCRLRLRASFKNDRRGADAALEQLLKALCKADVLSMVSAAKGVELYGVTTSLYAVGGGW